MYPFFVVAVLLNCKWLDDRPISDRSQILYTSMEVFQFSDTTAAIFDLQIKRFVLHLQIGGFGEFRYEKLEKTAFTVLYGPT